PGGAPRGWEPPPMWLRGRAVRRLTRRAGRPGLHADHLELLVDVDGDARAVRADHVHLVGGMAVGVGLDATDGRVRLLRDRGGARLARGLAREQRLVGALRAPALRPARLRGDGRQGAPGGARARAARRTGDPVASARNAERQGGGNDDPDGALPGVHRRTPFGRFTPDPDAPRPSPRNLRAALPEPESCLGAARATTRARS